MIQIPIKKSYDKIEKFVSINVITGYRIKVKNGWIHKKRFSNKYELIFVADGFLNISIDDNLMVLKKNDLLIIPPYCIVSGTKKSEDFIDFYTIEFFCDNFSFFKIQNMCINAKNRGIVEIVQILNTICNADNELDCIHDAALLSLLYKFKTSNEKIFSNNILITQIVDYINENITNPLSVDKISKHFNYNNDYISRIFKDCYGYSIKDYINRQKLALAKKLLITSDISINKIAESLGFADGTLFNKFFYYHENITPTRYRINVGNFKT